MPRMPKSADNLAARPRSRGAHLEEAGVVHRGEGSSPLARGSHGPDVRSHGARGLIPARAGLTAHDGVTGGEELAHPRSRGAHDFAACSVAGPHGSSPLARGSPRGRSGRGLLGGLIPARAGLTDPDPGAVPGVRAHPRSRGAHLPVRLHLRQGCGLIPARAGLTRPAGPHGQGPGAHPRSRGAHGRTVRWAVPQWGSSPLARGSLHELLEDALFGGLIPARAGLTPPNRPPPSCGGAHPRSRGAHAVVSSIDTPVAGSSPLARGSQKGGLFIHLAVGLIPARAGLTPQTAPPRGACAAHPRSRGAHLGLGRSGTWYVGSSPLARGSPAALALAAIVGGLIPARAGLTAGRAARP